MALEKEASRQSMQHSTSSCEKGSDRGWFVPPELQIDRKVLQKCLEALDYVDSPDRPGLMHADAFQAMALRFDCTFGKTSKTWVDERAVQIDAALEHLRRHTMRRRGEVVVEEGYIEWEATSKAFDLFTIQLNTFERIYFTVDIAAFPSRQERVQWLPRVCSICLVLMIIVSILLWIISTLPYAPIRAIPAGCVGAAAGECAPVPVEIFETVERICIYVFTLEYLIKLFTVHSVRFAVGNELFLEGIIGGGAVETMQAERLMCGVTSFSMPVSMKQSEKQRVQEYMDGPLRATVKHVFSFASLVDIFSIMPFWIEAFSGVAGSGGAITLIRILRLSRVFRVFKLGKYNDVWTLFSRVMNQSASALILLLVVVFLDCCLFGALMWFAEQGTWYPSGHEKLIELDVFGRGAYLRRDSSVVVDPAMEILQETPFVSIIHSFWYVIVTITTVGYGDMYPTTELGKIIASVTALSGIIVLAMPIGVVGANFSSEYYRVQSEKKQRERLRQQTELRRAIEEEQDSALTQDGGCKSEIGTEIQRLFVARQKILLSAQEIDTIWQELLPELRYTPISGNLRRLVRALLDLDDEDDSESIAKGKPVVSMKNLLDLDVLTTEVLSAVAAASSAIVMHEIVAEDTCDFGLKEAKNLRQSWFAFTNLCWEYAVDMCRIVSVEDPPEFFRMKAHLARKNFRERRLSGIHLDTQEQDTGYTSAGPDTPVQDVAKGEESLDRRLPSADRLRKAGDATQEPQAKAGEATVLLLPGETQWS